MNPQDIFAAAKRLTGDRLSAFLDEQCDGNPELRRQVDALLAADQSFDMTIDSADKPADGISPTLDSNEHSEHSSGSEPSFVLGPSPTVSSSSASESHKSFEVVAAPGDWIGVYQLIKPLGKGGMGDVWMAEQKEPVKRHVALKLIRAGTGSREILSRFESERQALALMSHPNVARIIDAGTTPSGQPFFAMELVDGQTLTEYSDQNRLSIDDRLKLFVAVCSGVQHAHQKGIIHRDLKPSNIMVTEVDGKPIPKVIDFGLAKAIQSSDRLNDQSIFTGIGQILGTLKYMSPEQARLDSNDIDTRTDIYSLGIILYELLTGQTPLDNPTIKGKAALDVLAFIRNHEPLKPSSRLSNSNAQEKSAIVNPRRTDSARLSRILAGDLDWVVMKSLEKERARRYDSAGAFAEDVERFLHGEAVVARPPSTGYRIRKFVGKNRGLVTTLTTIAALLVAGISGTTWFAFQADTARIAELKQKQIAQQKTEEAVELQQKESASRQLAEKRLAESLASLGDLAVQKGELRKAIGLFDEALGTGHMDPGELNLKRIEALFSLLAYDQIELELEDFEATGLSTEQRARLRFFEGLIDEKEGARKIQEALEIGLPAGYDSLANACLAHDLTSFVELSSRAVESLPTSAIAQKSYLSGLFMTGQLDEARDQAIVLKTLSPEDYTIDLVLALMEQDEERQKMHMENARDFISPEVFSAVRKLIKLNADQRQINQEKSAINPVADAMTFINYGKVLVTLTRSPELAFGSRIYRVPAFGDITSNFVSGTRKALFGMDEDAATDFQAINSQISLADTLYLEAVVRQRIGAGSDDAEKQMDYLRQAESLFLQAQATEFALSFETVRSFSHYALLLTQYFIWMKTDWKDDDVKARAIANLLELEARISRPEEVFMKFDSGVFDQIVEISTQLKRPEQTRVFSELWMQRYPKSKLAQIQVAKLEFESNRLFRAYDLVTAVVEKRPKDESSIALRELILSALKEQLDSREIAID